MQYLTNSSIDFSLLHHIGLNPKRKLRGFAEESEKLIFAKIDLCRGKVEARPAA